MNKDYYQINHAQFEGLAREILGKGNQLYFHATGRSMMPFIQEGDGVVLDPIEKIPRLGDVVLARTPAGSLVLHRVVRKSEEEIITRGDATNKADSPIPYKDIFGRVAKISTRGNNLHLRFPFRLLLVAKPAAHKLVTYIPGRHLLKRILVYLLS